MNIVEVILSFVLQYPLLWIRRIWSIHGSVQNLLIYSLCQKIWKVVVGMEEHKSEILCGLNPLRNYAMACLRRCSDAWDPSEILSSRKSLSLNGPTGTGGLA